MLGISQSTAEADWTYAKTWLKREIEKALKKFVGGFGTARRIEVWEENIR